MWVTAFPTESARTAFKPCSMNSWNGSPLMSRGITQLHCTGGFSSASRIDGR